MWGLQAYATMPALVGPVFFPDLLLSARHCPRVSHLLSLLTSYTRKQAPSPTEQLSKVSFKSGKELTIFSLNKPTDLQTMMVLLGML